LIDEKQKDADGVYLGRSEYDAPEVDGIVYVHTDKKLKAGDFVDVFIDDALEYDLVGRVI
jgi:ribosomal protein S12 methylthiotransferase